MLAQVGQQVIRVAIELLVCALEIRVLCHFAVLAGDCIRQVDQVALEPHTVDAPRVGVKLMEMGDERQRIYIV